MNRIFASALGLALMSSVAFAAETGEGAAAPAAEPKKEVLKQNGIKRPEPGTVTGALWDIADRISEEKHRPALRKEVVDAYMAEQPNANVSTAQTQYARWVQYHGAAKALKQIRDQEAETGKAAKEAEKAEKARVKAEEKAAKDAEAKAAKEAKDAERKANKEQIEKDRAEKVAAKEAAKAAEAKPADAKPAKPAKK